MAIHLEKVPLAEPIERDDFVLFSESNTRFLAEVAPGDKQEFEKMMSGVDFTEIGQVINNEKFEVFGRNGMVLTATLAELKEAWQKPLRW
jgi:phosphoribosylformylglycinamidine synthase